MYNYLKTFRKLLMQLIEASGNLTHNNVVIGGLEALKAHGLITTRESNDIDVIIYQPTENQKKLLESLTFFDSRNDGLFPSDESRRSFKFKKDDKYMDVLIEDKPMPEDLLLYRTPFDEQLFNIQSIKGVIDAKRSYHIEHGTHRGYVRDKDVRDFIDLKNSNFNLTVNE